MNRSPGAALKTSFTTARPSGSHAPKPLPYARTWLLTLQGASHVPSRVRCMTPSSSLFNAVSKLLPRRRVDVVGQ